MSLKKNLLNTLCLLALSLAITGCDQGGEPSDLRRVIRDLKGRIQNLEKDKKALTDQNSRLREELAAAEGGKGLSTRDKDRRLDNRAASLKIYEERLTEREAQISEKEKDLDQRKNEFHRRTNEKMISVGEANQLKTEYEIMRKDKDEALAEAAMWLKFAWGVSITVGLSLLVISILIYRSFSKQAEHRRETEYRKEVAQLLGASISQRLPPDQAATVIESFDRLVHIEDNRNTAVTETGEST